MEELDKLHAKLTIGAVLRYKEERNAKLDKPPIKPHTEVVVPVLPNCDFCQREDKEVKADCDGKTVFGPWANMCSEHYEAYGVGLGLGRGQRLVTQRR